MYDQIISFTNLLKAYYKARRSKRFKRRLQKIEIDFEDRLINICYQLKNQSYQPKKYHRFLVFEPKKRQISAPAFIDRIIHHAILIVIEPLFDKLFIPSSFACQKNKGTHSGMLYIARRYGKLIKKYEILYALKCDIKQYFANIEHNALFELLSKVITCPKTLWLLKLIIDSYKDSPGKGIPIGNLTSQLFANIYLHELDLYVTKYLKVQYYFRYMDDFLVLSHDIEPLKKLREKIKLFLSEKLYLSLHPKKVNIFRADRGLDFVGYCIKPDGISMRKKTLRRYKKRHKKRIKLLEKSKMQLKKYKTYSQLPLFTTSKLNDEVKYELEEKIRKQKEKLRASRNSFKGFLRYSKHKKLATGGVKVNGIIIPKIFSRKKISSKQLTIFQFR
ncbi:RNA-dependent DNA polymerase [Candidatus Roizmanbacteria bacterium CG_4_9_14_0_8_um_filter_34_12]|uniref:RNA-dependent DNA polymerase n=2 Tax=Candidatus Roizmaniibacteriota TaxID=1752723 RepID=A0A2M7M1B0_9BACT|nr:MAG: RNA-dependent DNA polymerase [Candidatus Roizmanbacteria bacterium CG_4_10_14_3_um_filter_33_21]PJB88061.1 MAG: RNA-dependent DNA polymerase [Candidatus Roizmanbacteria bacterium CG_4_9_14_0_8_um_filter_34_12]